MAVNGNRHGVRQFDIDLYGGPKGSGRKVRTHGIQGVSRCVRLRKETGCKNGGGAIVVGNEDDVARIGTLRKLPPFTSVVREVMRELHHTEKGALTYWKTRSICKPPYIFLETGP